MSLYTPVFPHTVPPKLQTPSTSSSSIQTDNATRKQPSAPASYSSRLSQWHLAIASLPAELCPPSRETSPTSKTRSEALRSEVEDAVRRGRYAGDLCKTRYSRRGIASKYAGTSAFGATNVPIDTDDLQYVLAETEEDWFAWQEKAKEARSKRVLMPESSRQVVEQLKTKTPPTESVQDRVIDWRARLPSTKMAREPQDEDIINIRSVTGQTNRAKPEGASLGFPVVKRSMIVKERTEKRTSKRKSAGQASLLEISDEVSLPTLGIRKANPQTKLDAVTVENAVSGTPLSHGKAIKGSARVLAEAVPLLREDLHDLSAMPPPPSFPVDLPTSTPRKVIDTSGHRHFDVVNSTPSNQNDDAVIDGGGPRKIKNTPQERSPRRHSPVTQVTSHKGGDDIRIGAITTCVPRLSTNHQPLYSTPPSPPASSSASPAPHSAILQDVRPSDTEAIILMDSTSFTVVPSVSQERVKPTRPLTPVSDEPAPPAKFDVAMPRTPERSPLKRHRTTGFNSPDNNYVGTSTPLAQINGISRKKSLPFPQTPERPVFVDLATSKKSLPRPRPPRKLAIENSSSSLANHSGPAEPSPAKSERSYFSSPGSGSSEPSPALTRYGHDQLASSPLGPGQFTQNPTKFAPMAMSTQQPAQTMLGDLQSSPTAKTNVALSRQASVTRQGLLRGSSGILGIPYNSQFDLDANVDRVSHLLERDVDFAAWVKDEDDDEDDEVCVENMTSTQE